MHTCLNYIAMIIKSRLFVDSLLLICFEIANVSVVYLLAIHKNKGDAYFKLYN